MSTIDDFENAPIGATATYLDGSRAMKMGDGEWGRAGRLARFYYDDEEMVHWGYTLDPLEPAPTTAREALDLAWELAHPVKEGQVIPEGARYLMTSDSGVITALWDFKITPGLAPIRTLEPLPEPEPDWLNAPAVLAGFDGWSHDEREVFVPIGPHNHWTRVGSSLTSHWSDLRDVTPLYPKETE